MRKLRACAAYAAAALAALVLGATAAAHGLDGPVLRPVTTPGR
jgi:hypothetical protein